MGKRRDPIILPAAAANILTALECALKEDYMPAVKDELLRAIDEKVAQLAADEERKLYARGPLIEVQSVQHPILERLAACAAGDRKAYVLLKAPRNAWVDGKVVAVDYGSGFATVRVDVHSGSRALVGWNDWTFNVEDVAMLREHHDVP